LHQALVSERQGTHVKKKGKRAAKKRERTNGGRDTALREHLVYLLKGGGAHVHFIDALEGFLEQKRGTYANGLPHTGWQLLEHSRLAQWDILEFSRNPKHVSPEFPEGYWPKTPGPPDEAAWDKSVRQFQKDLDEMIRLVKNPRTDLYEHIPHGQRQTILREALLLADHNSYHLGQLVDLRRALGIWPEG
jgi:DinB superfamily